MLTSPGPSMPHVHTLTGSNCVFVFFPLNLWSDERQESFLIKLIRMLQTHIRSCAAHLQLERESPTWILFFFSSLLPWQHAHLVGFPWDCCHNVACSSSAEPELTRGTTRQLWNKIKIAHLDWYSGEHLRLLGDWSSIGVGGDVMPFVIGTLDTPVMTSWSVYIGMKYRLWVYHFISSHKTVWT